MYKVYGDNLYWEWKKTYMANHIVRMGTFNCFVEFTSATWQLNVVIESWLIHRCKETMWPTRSFKNGCLELLWRVALVNYYLHVAYKRHANNMEIVRSLCQKFRVFTDHCLLLLMVLLKLTDRIVAQVFVFLISLPNSEPL